MVLDAGPKWEVFDENQFDDVWETWNVLTAAQEAHQSPATPNSQRAAVALAVIAYLNENNLQGHGFYFDCKHLGLLDIYWAGGWHWRWYLVHKCPVPLPDPPEETSDG